MDDAERQRTMDFILRQQAQFAAGVQKVDEKQVRFADDLKQLSRLAVLMARQFRRERGDLRERIAALVDAQVKSEDRISRSDERQAQAEESFARSDTRLTRLEDITERNSKDIAALTYTVECNSGDIHALLLSTERNIEAISALTASNDRNREDIAALAKVVADMARRRNGDNGTA